MTVVELWALEAFSVAALVALGVFCIIGNKNTIKILMGITILARAVSLTFLIGGVHNAALASAQAMMIAVTVIDAAVTALGMSMVVNIYRHYRTVETDKLRRLNG